MQVFNSIFSFLMRNPKWGLGGSLLSITLTHLQVLQIIAAVLGIIIAVITAILKVIELRDKLEEKKTGKPKPKRFTKKKTETTE